MQLYALDNEKKVVFVEDAHKQEGYFCIECGCPLRVRGGIYRRSHYYHLSKINCNQSAKSIEHLQTQYFFKENLPDQVQLEQQFLSVGRIADVVWEKEKIIFEVQCSQISALEVAARNRDYAKCGYQVIWVLHEKNFNKKRLTAAEHFLRGSPYYFTNINKEGSGFIYDQHRVVKKWEEKSEKVEVKLSLQRTSLKGIRKKWPCHLKGTLDIPVEKLKKPISKLKRLYYSLFQVLLESACR